VRLLQTVSHGANPDADKRRDVGGKLFASRMCDRHVSVDS
jgi:hypothetical protein